MSFDLDNVIDKLKQSNPTIDRSPIETKYSSARWVPKNTLYVENNQPTTNRSDELGDAVDKLDGFSELDQADWCNVKPGSKIRYMKDGKLKKPCTVEYVDCNARVIGVVIFLGRMRKKYTIRLDTIDKLYVHRSKVRQINSDSKPRPSTKLSINMNNNQTADRPPDRQLVDRRSFADASSHNIVSDQNAMLEARIITLEKITDQLILRIAHLGKLLKESIDTG